MTPAQRALLDLMVLTSASDGDMRDAELDTLSTAVRYAPVFRGVIADDIPQICRDSADLLMREDGLDVALRRIKDVLPPPLRDTAYALAVEIVAADLVADQEELELLEMIKDALEIPALEAAAIEYGARVRHRIA